jgi:hypothetical protein
MPRLVKSGSGTRIGARFAGLWSGTPRLTCAEPPPTLCIHIVQRKLGIKLHAAFEPFAYNRGDSAYSMLPDCVFCEGLGLYHTLKEYHYTLRVHILTAVRYTPGLSAYKVSTHAVVLRTFAGGYVGHRSYRDRTSGLQCVDSMAV